MNTTVIFYIMQTDGAVIDGGITSAPIAPEVMISNLERNGITERVNGEGEGWEICTNYKNTLHVYQLPPQPSTGDEEEDIADEDPDPSTELVAAYDEDPTDDTTA